MPPKIDSASLIRKIEEVDAIVDLLLDKLVKIKTDCHKARRKLEGVSTSSVPKGLKKKVYADVVARRNQRMFKN